MSEQLDYIAKCKCGCGGIVLVISGSDDWRKQAAKSIAEAIRDGYTIERMHTTDVRKATWNCQKQKPSSAIQEDLLLYRSLTQGSES